MSEERLMILKMLKDGKLTVEEADALLQVLQEQEDEGQQAAADTERETQASASTNDEVPEGFEGYQNSFRGARMPRPPRPPRPARPPRPPRLSHTLRDEILARVRESLQVAGIVSPGGAIRDLFDLSPASEDIDLTLPMPAGGRVIVRNPRGDVRLERAEGSNVRVRGTKRAWGKKAESAEVLLRYVQVDLYQEGSNVVAEVRTAPPEVHRVRFRVDLTVEVPEGASAEIEVMSGDVHVEHLNGDLELSVASGDVFVGPHGGAISGEVKRGDVQVAEADECELRVMSGDVEVKDVRGKARLSVSRGDVALGLVRGDLEAVVHSGDLTFAVEGARDVTAKVMSGDLDGELRSLADRATVSVDVMSGDLDLGLGAEVRGTVDVEVKSGELDVAVPLAQVRRSRGRVEGILGSADGKVRVRVMSGDVSIQPL